MSRTKLLGPRMCSMAIAKAEIVERKYNIINR